MPVVVLMLSLVAGQPGCSSFKNVERELATPESFETMPEGMIESLQEGSPYLKVHMQSGAMYVLHDWSMDPLRRSVSGDGTLFGAGRDTLATRHFRVGFDSVAIFETNVLRTSSSAAALTIFTGITAVVTVYCIANPKACFGSCPTFYLPDGDSLRPRAEGFSSSIAPSLEAADVDALLRSVPAGEEYAVEMRNEALETHIVRHVDLLAVPRRYGCRIFADAEGRFWECVSFVPPAGARGPEGDCLDLLAESDDRERFSRADSAFLGAKEVVELRFEGVPESPCGLVIGCRQTLLSTYLLYQTYAYMGENAGYWLAQIERGNVTQHRTSVQDIMGGIEIRVRDSAGGWRACGRFREYGPLAVDHHLVMLGSLPGGMTEVRLIMTKGNWRIDRVGLAVLSRPVDAVRLRPLRVLKDGLRDDLARAALCDSARTLVTLPGDTYTLQYRMPDAPGEYELFLESRGYYIEWIRKEWIEEEDPILLAQMFLDPRTALTRLAPEYKQVEEEMEDCFWNSRYAKP